MHLRAEPGMDVPMLDLRRQNQEVHGELSEAFQRVLQSGKFILGQEVTEFETAFAKLLGVPYVIGISSGTDAILLALMALGIGPGDEVLCPSFTFFATAGCVSRVGATPVFVDSCPECFNLDAQDAATKISPRTKAIVPVHLFGQSAEMASVIKLSHAHNLMVIEDAAQAVGATYKDQTVGGIGHCGAFSFFPSKNLGGFGDAGAFVTRDAQLAERAKILRVHGAEPKYYHHYVGGNFRLDAIQAALLMVKLRRLAQYTEKRRANASYYIERLSKIPGVDMGGASHCCQFGSDKATLFSTKPGGTEAKIILPSVRPTGGHTWNQFTLRVTAGRRKDLHKFLSEQGIGSEIYYPIPLHKQECFRGLPDASCPIAESISDECLSIPIYPELTTKQQDHVVKSVEAWVRRS